MANDKGKDACDNSDRAPSSSGNDDVVDERVLIAGCLLGEKDSLGRLVLLYTHAVYTGAVAAIKAHHGRKSADADDLVHEILLRRLH